MVRKAAQRVPACGPRQQRGFPGSCPLLHALSPGSQECWAVCWGGRPGASREPRQRSAGLCWPAPGRGGGDVPRCTPRSTRGGAWRWAQTPEALPTSVTSTCASRRYCPKCKQHREASKQLMLWRLPNVLIIQLKRFSFRSFIWRDKINDMVDFPVR